MPWKRVGRTIYGKRGGTWVKKQTCRSVDAAKAALRKLNALHKKEKKR